MLGAMSCQHHYMHDYVIERGSVVAMARRDELESKSRMLQEYLGV